MLAMLLQLSDLGLLCSTNNLLLLDWLFKQNYMLNGGETVCYSSSCFSSNSNRSLDKQNEIFYMLRAPPIMFTSSASLTSKPTLEIYLSKHSLSPNSVKIMLLKENGDWVQWLKYILRICSQKNTGQVNHSTEAGFSVPPLIQQICVIWAISLKLTWKVQIIVPVYLI